MAAKNDSLAHTDRRTNLKPELVDKLLALQEQDLQFKGEQLTLEREREANLQELAKASIDAQLQDRQAQREHLERQQKSRLYVVALAMVLVVALCIYAISHEKDGVVLELIKLLAVFIGGWGTGYGLRNKSSRSSDRKEQDM